MPHSTYLLLPLLVGLSQPVIWQMNVRASKIVGEMESAVILHVVGSLVGIAWVFGGARGDASFAAMAQIPWWAWAGVGTGVAMAARLPRALIATVRMKMLAMLVRGRAAAAWRSWRRVSS